MQLKVAKVLNQILIGLFVVVAGIALGILFLLQQFPNLKWLLLGSFILIGIALFGIYRWFEQNWDKRVIMRMAQNGSVALANIRSAERIQPMRDTSFIRYWLFEFQGDLYDTDLHRLEKKFYEKMNAATEDVPIGSVFVTYDPKKPDQIFIIPNDIVSRIPSLAPLAAKFESNKAIQVRYLDVYYNKGINIRTFREAVAEHKKRKQDTDSI